MCITLKCWCDRRMCRVAGRSVAAAFGWRNHTVAMFLFLLLSFIAIIDNTSALLYYRGRLFNRLWCLLHYRTAASSCLFVFIFWNFLRPAFIDFRYVRMRRAKDFFFLFPFILFKDSPPPLFFLLFLNCYSYFKLCVFQICSLKSTVDGAAMYW